MATLYRQYRPQNFAEILGQNYVKTILQNEIASGNIAHAYLFCGPRAVGKTTMARVLAKAVNCLQIKAGEFEPCDKCDNCLSINNGRNLDIVEIDAASNTGVDNVRENIISSSRVGSPTNKYKVFIIDEVHMLSISAFNALLKVLEEPPTHVIFVLCTTELHKIPSTIISRCQRFDFKRLSVSDMVQKMKHIVELEKIEVEDGVLEAVARHSDGYMRDAESLLGQIMAVGDHKITRSDVDLVIPRSDFAEIIKLIEHLNNKDAAKAISLVNALFNDGFNLKSFLLDAVEVLRKMMLDKLSPNLANGLGLDYGDSLEIEINKLNAELKLEQIALYAETFSAAINDLKYSAIIQLPLELAIINLCTAVKVVPEIVTTTISAKTISNNPTNSITQVNVVKEEVKTTPVKIVVKNPGSVSADLITERWNEVLLKVKPINHSLYFVLQSSRVDDFSDNIITLVFKYKFHKDRIMSPEVKTSLENILAEVYGANLGINAILDENLDLASVVVESAPVESSAAAENTKPDDNIINNILNTFGGEIVN